MKRPNAVSMSNSGSSVKQTDLKKEVSRSDIPRDGVWRKWRDKVSEIHSLKIIVRQGVHSANMEEKERKIREREEIIRVLEKMNRIDSWNKWKNTVTKIAGTRCCK